MLENSMRNCNQQQKFIMLYSLILDIYYAISGLGRTGISFIASVS